MVNASSSTRAPTIRDVAALAGVSTATVSRVLRGEDSVRHHKVEAVIRAAEELGYVPNQAARSLVERRTGAIALIVPERETRVFSDPYFGAMVQGVSSALEATDHQLILVMNTSQDSARLRRFVRGGHADGLIVASRHADDQLTEALQAAAVPVVSIGRSPDGSTGPFVDLDNIHGGRMAAARLLEIGRSRIALLGGPAGMSAAEDRRRGVLEALAESSVAPVLQIPGEFTYASGTRAAEALLTHGTQIDGVFAASDLMALGLLAGLRSYGVRIPEDIAVVGFDDIDMAADPAVELTTVTNPGRELAGRATTMLLDLLAGRPIDEQTILTPQLVVRRSA